MPVWCDSDEENYAKIRSSWRIRRMIEAINQPGVSWWQAEVHCTLVLWPRPDVPRSAGVRTNWIRHWGSHCRLSLASDWSGPITWPVFWPLIGRDRHVDMRIEQEWRHYSPCQPRIEVRPETWDSDMGGGERSWEKVRGGRPWPGSRQWESHTLMMNILQFEYINTTNTGQMLNMMLGFTRVNMGSSLH